MLDFIDTYVAREHWLPILSMAAVEMLVLVLLFTTVGATVVEAVAITHFLTTIGGIFLTVVALKAKAGQSRDHVVSLARRAVSTLLVSGVSLMFLVLLVETAETT